MEPFPHREALRSVFYKVTPICTSSTPCKLRIPSSNTSGNNYGHMSSFHDFPSLPKPHDGSPVYLALLLDTGNRRVLPKKNETHIPRSTIDSHNTVLGRFLVLSSSLLFTNCVISG